MSKMPVVSIRPSGYSTTATLVKPVVECSRSECIETTGFFVTINYLDILNQTVYNRKNGKTKISF